MKTIHFLMFFAIIFSFLAKTCAVSTARIDVVRAKETLAEADTAIIEEFLTSAFEEFYAKTDFSDIASVRSTIISRSESNLESGQIQYGPRFLTAVQSQIAGTLEKAGKLPDSPRKQLLTMNLLILINDLGNLEISKIALNYTQTPEVTVRYWAVNCLTNGGIVRQLNTAGSNEAEQFVQNLQTVVKNETSGDILILAAQFAAAVKSPAANELLVEIAQKRAASYLNWQVSDEMVECTILKSLSDRTQIDPDNAKITAKEFAILYSLVVQRYALSSGVLPAENINNLVSVIVLSEKYITRFIPDWPGSLKRAVEKGGGAGLLVEHDALFGSASAAGKLPTAAGFDYGKNADGSIMTAPPQLPKPPAKVIETKSSQDANE
ncbi:MAG TPA: hypothetical protein DDW84_07545 [Phycisphaerales bacterium]|nr:MAG: hypothetical protein A2Y13_11075 [Planctomycetes bacterium GWC2_45_44]HBG78677.1 hypothetical protein [Phycisphaerales bacterium]HBR20054.1 hypothetical protein [Phycisphaerales bacterium]